MLGLWKVAAPLACLEMKTFRQVLKGGLIEQFVRMIWMAKTRVSLGSMTLAEPKQRVDGVADQPRHLKYGFSFDGLLHEEGSLSNVSQAFDRKWPCLKDAV